MSGYSGYNFVTLDHVTVSDNRAAGAGGGINSSKDLSSSEVSGNQATGGGGGISGYNVSATDSFRD
ncbi:MAG: hypothetical protein U1E52_17445 [Geminicoccaceae bacterium]